MSKNPKTALLTINDNLNRFQHIGEVFVRMILGSTKIVAELMWTPKAEPAADAKTAPVARIQFKNSASKVGFNLTGSGSTVFTLCDSIPLMAAYVKHKIVAGKFAGGAVPADVKDAIRATFYGTTDKALWTVETLERNQPELVAAAKILIREMAKTKPQTTVAVTARFGGVECKTRISKTVEGWLSYAALLLPTATVSVRIGDVDVDAGTAAEIVAERRQIPTEIPAATETETETPESVELTEETETPETETETETENAA